MVDWHPRRTAHPVVWELRNGKHAPVYALVRALPEIENGRPVTQYELRSPTGQVLGVFATGDDVATFEWNWYVKEGGVRHHLAAKRAHER